MSGNRLPSEAEADRLLAGEERAAMLEIYAVTALLHGSGQERSTFFSGWFHPDRTSRRIVHQLRPAWHP